MPWKYTFESKVNLPFFGLTFTLLYSPIVAIFVTLLLFVWGPFLTFLTSSLPPKLTFPPEIFTFAHHRFHHHDCGVDSPQTVLQVNFYWIAAAQAHHLTLPGGNWVSIRRFLRPAHSTLSHASTRRDASLLLFGEVGYSPWHQYSHIIFIYIILTLYLFLSYLFYSATNDLDNAQEGERRWWGRRK